MGKLARLATESKAQTRRAQKLRCCLMCGAEFKPLGSTHRYCGSRLTKSGCSYTRRLIKSRQYDSRYRKEDPERIYGHKKKWLKTHPEWKKEYDKKYHHVRKLSPKRQAYLKKYRSSERYKQLMKEGMKRFLEKHPDYYKNYKRPTKP